MEFPEALIVQRPIGIAIHRPDDHLRLFQETWYLLQPELHCRDLLKALITRAIVWTSFSSLQAIPTRATYNRPTGICRWESAESSQGNTIGGQILNMFKIESQPTLQRIDRRIWTISRQLYYPHTHTQIARIGVRIGRL